MTLSATSAWAGLNPTTAQNYENNWWDSYNPDFTHYSDDCANFVSQVLNYSGLPMNPVLGGTNQPTQWYYNGNDGAISTSWTVAVNLFNYLVETGNGGENYQFGYWSSGTAPSTTGNTPGDPFFYNWQNEYNGEYEAGINHTTVTYASNEHGTDGTSGTMVDSHTNPRNQVFWTLKFVTNPSNSYWQTETVFAVHVTG